MIGIKANPFPPPLGWSYAVTPPNTPTPEVTDANVLVERDRDGLQATV